jgi:hypothetical protein
MWVCFSIVFESADVALLVQIISNAETVDFLALWARSDADDDSLMEIFLQNTIHEHPDPQYSAWVNNYPSPWRHLISCLTANDWRYLRDATKRYQTPSTSISPRQHIILPQDVALWIGAMIMRMLLFGLSFLHPTSVAPLAMFWLILTNRFFLTSPPRLASFLPGATARLVRQAVQNSDHRCYDDFLEYLELYVWVLQWLQMEFLLPPLQVHWPSEKRTCSGCRTAGVHDVGNFLKGGIATSLKLDFSHLEERLASFHIAISPSETPLVWLSANEEHVSSTVSHFLGRFSEEYSVFPHCVPKIHLVSRTVYTRSLSCVSTLFYPPQRLAVYTLAILEFATLQSFNDTGTKSPFISYEQLLSGLLTDLKQAFKLWATWDDLTSLLQQRSITQYLWGCVRICQNACIHYVRL